MGRILYLRIDAAGLSPDRSLFLVERTKEQCPVLAGREVDGHLAYDNVAHCQFHVGHHTSRHPFGALQIWYPIRPPCLVIPLGHGISSSLLPACLLEAESQHVIRVLGVALSQKCSYTGILLLHPSNGSLHVHRRLHTCAGRGTNYWFQS